MEFPALWIAREGSFGVIDAPMNGGSFSAYRKGFFDGLKFFDSSGKTWEVETAVLKRKPSVVDRLLNRRVALDLQMRPPCQPALVSIAELLCSCVDRDPDDLYDQFVSHEKLKALFRTAVSAPGLIQLARTLGERDDAESTT